MSGNEVITKAQGIYLLTRLINGFAVNRIIKNMKNTRLTIGAAALAVIVTAGIAANTFAYHGDPSVTGPNYTAERHDAMETAFATGDYAAWKELMAGRGRVTQVVNEKNFAQFAKAHELAASGDLAGAATIRTGLGLGTGSKGQGRMGGQGQGMRNGAKGQNAGGNFVDANGDGVCDNQ